MENLKEQISVEPKITEAEKRIIREADWDTCALWHQKLNTWQWVDELLPEESPNVNINDYRSTRRNALMNYIEFKVGEKYLLMKHNTTKEFIQMTVGEFEDFWNGTRHGDTEAYERYRKIADSKLISNNQ